jgi:nitrate/nitrite transport system substrate-binding protein
VLDRVITGELDGAHMLGGPAARRIRSASARRPTRHGFSMDLNGKAVTVSNEVWGLMKPASHDEKGCPNIRSRVGAQTGAREIQGRGKPFKMAMVFPVSTHNYSLRYWLAAGGINPGSIHRRQ